MTELEISKSWVVTVAISRKSLSRLWFEGEPRRSQWECNNLSLGERGSEGVKSHSKERDPKDTKIWLRKA